jgi:signal transduction histidine kinase
MTNPDDVPEPGGDAWRIVCLGATPARTMALSALVSSALPAAAVDVFDLRMVTSLPDADLFVVDGSGDGSAMLRDLETVRARGGLAPAVLIGSAAAAADLARVGDVVVVPAEGLGTSLPNAVTEIALRVASRSGDPGARVLWQAVDDTRRLLAAGRIARRVKHDINNPLAALLAEAQLLELEDLGDEAKAAVGRIVELTRRIIDQARQLEGPKVGGTGPRAA